MKTCPKNGKLCSRFACKDEDECPQEEGAPPGILSGLGPAAKGGLAILGSIFIDALLEGPKHEPLTPRVIYHVMATTDLEIIDRPDDIECIHSPRDDLAEEDGSFQCRDCEARVRPPCEQHEWVGCLNPYYSQCSKCNATTATKDIPA